MKGELLPIVFFILLAALIAMGFIFFNIFYGTKYEVYILNIKKLDLFRNVVEQLKGYLGLSLTYSSNQALREHACLGGITDAGEWICNGPNPIPVKSSKECLELFTTYYFNIYFGSYEITLPLHIIKQNFSSCKYGIDEGGVLGGKFDEGNFWVNCSGARVILSSEDIQKFENLQTNEFITKNRFWYMFRIFTEWAREDIYSPCVCTCTSACADCKCAERCAEKALESLKNKFDEFVICEMSKVCCVRQLGPPCLPPSICLPWIADNPCPCNCMHECAPPPLGEVCLPGGSKMLSAFSEAETFSSILALGNGRYCGYENRLTSHYEFKCKDHKYYVPSSKGPLPLIFRVGAGACFRDQDACI